MSAAIKLENIPARKKILFVDDDRVTQALVASALEDDFEVICETSGSLAIESAEAVQPHLILLDLSMPNVDGFEVLKRLKSHPILSEIPIICVSGKQDEKSRTRAYERGAAGFMSKPVNVSQMSSDIQALVKSMNLKLHSLDGRKHMFIGFNETEMFNKLKISINQSLAGGEKAIVLSFKAGPSFFENDEFKQELENGRLIYLQIKPSLLTRLPYLEDLSPVLHDIAELTVDPTLSRSLYLESPEVVIDINAPERMTSKAILFAKLLNSNFKDVHYFSHTPTDSALASNLNALAKILIAD